MNVHIHTKDELKPDRYLNKHMLLKLLEEKLTEDDILDFRTKTGSLLMRVQVKGE